MEYGTALQSFDKPITDRWADIITGIKQDSINKENPQIKRYYLSDEQQGTYLTQREYEVLISLLKGLTHLEIAKLKNISLRTIEEYSANLRKKFGFARKQTMVRELLAKNYLSSLKMITPTIIY